MLNAFRHVPFRSNPPESPTAIDPSVFHPSRPQDMNMIYNPSVFSSFSSDNSSSESAPVPDLIPRTVTTSAIHTKVVPPPPVQPRKMDNAAQYKVVYPEKEACQKFVTYTAIWLSTYLSNALLFSLLVCLFLLQTSLLVERNHALRLKLELLSFLLSQVDPQEILRATTESAVGNGSNCLLVQLLGGALVRKGK